MMDEDSKKKIDNFFLYCENRIPINNHIRNDNKLSIRILKLIHRIKGNFYSLFPGLYAEMDRKVGDHLSSGDRVILWLKRNLTFSNILVIISIILTITGLVLNIAYHQEATTYTHGN